MAYRMSNFMTYSFSKNLLYLIVRKHYLNLKVLKNLFGFKNEIMALEKRNNHVDVGVMYEFIDG